MKIIFILTFLLFVFLSLASDVYAEEIQWDKLVIAICEVESSNNLQAFNKYSGAMGLMGVTPIVVEEINNAYKTDIRLPDLYDPIINTYVGGLYLHRLHDHYGCDTIKKTLGAYNWGIGNVKKADYVYSKYPKSVKEYIAKVLKEYNRLQSLGI